MLILFIFLYPFCVTFFLFFFTTCVSSFFLRCTEWQYASTQSVKSTFSNLFFVDVQELFLMINMNNDKQILN